MAFPKTLKNAAAESFSIVAAGDSATEAGFILTEDQMNSLEESFTASENVANENATTIQSLTEQVAAANTAREAAETATTTATANLATITADRDSWKIKAEEYGAKTDDPAQTGKKADSFSGDTKVKNSLDQYAEDMGVARY